MSNLRKSVPKPGPGAGAPRGKSPILKVIYVDDLLVFPASDENGVKTEGNIILKPGMAPVDFYATDDTIKPSHALEGDPDAEGFLKKMEASHPGDEIDVNEWLQNSLGEPFIILYPIDCDGLRHKILGTKCNPLYVTGAEFKDDKDGLNHLITFSQRRRDKLVAKVYDGVVPTALVTDVANFAVPVLNASGAIYQLPESAVADTPITITVSAGSDELYNKVITVRGNGGTEPASIESIEAVTGAQILLKGGAPWIALKDAVINFRILHTPGAPNPYHLIEVSRS
ncbi:hypothetical protein ACI6PS_02510 [Flavobacterium sp. PLA-1-15]|uniref:hypothetical protein n=1 Tax=Flavobacterium sp. PLA-1-15 TaxID=3380533 RepID=UPI003B7B6E23